MKSLFVTGTDTGVGKTIVCGLLGRFLLDKGIRTITQKWIQTGSVDFSEDILVHLELMGITKNSIQKYTSIMNSYLFRFPASPHLAAAMEDVKIDPEKIKSDYRRLAETFECVIVEGVGGMLVPYDQTYTVADIVEELNIPVLVVAKNKLGAINHTLLTIEALKKRNLKILGILFNESENENKQIASDNPRIIESISNVNIIGTLPWSNKNDVLQKAFKPIGDRILEILNND